LTPDDTRVLIEIDDRFVTRISIDAVETAVRAAISAADQDDPGRSVGGRAIEVGVRITGDQDIQELNRTFRGVDQATDVLSFSLQEGEPLPMPPDLPFPLGEIVVSYPYAERQAAELGHSVGMEIAWLLIHGALQLLGYAHVSEREAAEMEAVEAIALRSLGFRKR
jgi:probable rRNA maturation factor